MQTFTTSVGESRTVTADTTDSSGNPGSYTPGSGTWATDSPVVILTPTSDKTCGVTGTAPGTANVSLTLQSQTDGVPGANVTFTFSQVVTGGPIAACTFSEA